MPSPCISKYVLSCLEINGIQRVMPVSELGPCNSSTGGVLRWGVESVGFWLGLTVWGFEKGITIMGRCSK